MTVARRLWRSPALRFLALGAALFGIESLSRSNPQPSLTASRASASSSAPRGSSATRPPPLTPRAAVLAAAALGRLAAGRWANGARAVTALSGVAGGWWLTERVVALCQG